MFRRIFSCGGLLLVAAALIFLAPGASHAVPRGGFRSGGFHAGGFHYGGYHGGYYYGGYHHYPYYWGYHGSYPSYGSYGSSPYSGNYYPAYGSYPYYSYSDLVSRSGYYPGYSSLSSQSPPSSEDAASAPPIGSTSATLILTVPAGAKVWIDDTPMTSTGLFREFESPPLAPGKRYTCKVRVRWNENGQEVTQERQVEVSAGAHVHVDFPK
jgi:uncharacterized protein (TIGR03000 family)